MTIEIYSSTSTVDVWGELYWEIILALPGLCSESSPVVLWRGCSVVLDGEQNRGIFLHVVQEVVDVEEQQLQPPKQRIRKSYQQSHWYLTSPN